MEGKKEGRNKTWFGPSSFATKVNVTLMSLDTHFPALTFLPSLFFPKLKNTAMIPLENHRYRISDLKVRLLLCFSVPDVAVRGSQLV